MQVKQTPTIALIGAGNLATNLGKALVSTGHRVVQVYSRTEQSAHTLADILQCQWTVSVDDITAEADIYIVSLKDSALTQLAPSLVAGREKALWLHTAGSIPMDVLPCPRRGVLYPMQTFSKQKEVDFSIIPCFIEAACEKDEQELYQLASRLSKSVHTMTSADRCYLHLAAVFCCNFANHCYAISQQLLQQHGNVPFSVMMPLIEETVGKLHTLSPSEGQTGPAVRWDENVISRHEALLSNYPSWQNIYTLMSESIHRLHEQNS